MYVACPTLKIRIQKDTTLLASASKKNVRLAQRILNILFYEKRTLSFFFFFLMALIKTKMRTRFFGYAAMNV
jgi:hypothetical protein